MTSADYRIMQWHSAMDGPWSPEATRSFQQGGFDGLVVIPNADWTPQDLSFLADLEGLRSFSFTGKLRNDLAAFAVPTLEDLTLVTGSKLAVPEVAQARLSRLCLTDRPGITLYQHWPNLEWLRVGVWKATNLSMLEKAARLKHLHLEGRRQQGALDGIEDCVAIESLTIINYSVRDTAPLLGLNMLTEVKLLAAKPTAPHNPLDLAKITSQRLAKLWISNASEVLNLGALASHTALRELRLIGCQLSEADMRTLSSFPRQINVELVND